MQQNLYYKCNICGSICDIKYEYGFSKEHPIRYKCKCGVTISGAYTEERGIKFENATETANTNAKFVVNVSGELLTPASYDISSKEDSIRNTSFIEAVSKMDYENYKDTLSSIIKNRDYLYPKIRIINDLYKAKNTSLLKKKIREYFDPTQKFFPLNNKADYLRAVTMINQFQFLGCSDLTKKVTDCYIIACRKNEDVTRSFIKYLSDLNIISDWKDRLNTICNQFYNKVDLLMPAISIDYYYDNSILNDENYSITTTSFEDIKQLYVDLYELISSLLILPLGFDNIVLRNDYEKINTLSDFKNIKTLNDIKTKMRNKGNIIKFINSEEPLQSLLCTCLNSDIRNSIGHFSYHSEEVAGNSSQKICFKDDYSSSGDVEISLINICYSIWCMYKCLAIFNELIHQIEMQQLAILENIAPTYIEKPNLAKRMVKSCRKKIYPNDPCPCGSGLKYKKCCKNTIQ